jgi:hypothetical protein
LVFLSRFCQYPSADGPGSALQPENFQLTYGAITQLKITGVSAGETFGLEPSLN